MTRQETIQQKTTQQEPIRQELPQPNGEAPRANLRLAIDGMHCANCAANIEKHYRATPGVVDVAVNLANNTGRVVFDPAQASVDDMLAVFDNLAFTAEISRMTRPWWTRGAAPARPPGPSGTARCSARPPCSR